MFGRLKRRLRRRAVADEVDSEIRAHIALRERDLREQGLDPESARREALRRFGDVARARERLYGSAARRDRQRRWVAITESLVRDCGLALRRIRQAPAFAALAVATFALGVGLTTATFSVVDHVLLRDLPYPEPDRLVALMSTDENGSEFPYVSAANWIDWRDAAASLEVTALHGFPRRVGAGFGDESFYLNAVYVAGSYFDTLGAPFVVGRGFTADEAQDNAPVAVVTEELWRRALGADPSLDAEIFLAGRSRTVLGVVRSGAAHPGGVDTWLPIPVQPGSGADRNNINFMSVARLAVGVTPDEARAELGLIADRIRRTDPEGVYSWGVGVVPLRDLVVAPARGYLLLLLAAVAFVLLVACANLAGLGLARGSARRQETAVRRALGAGRVRVVQQEVIDHLVLALAGGAVGIFGAWLGIRALTAGLVATVPRALEIRMDLRVLAAGLALSAAAGLLAGVIPALRTSGAAPAAALRGSGRTVRGGGRLPGSLVVIVEVAFAVMLLVGSSLLVRSLLSLVGRDLGYDPRGVVVAEVDLDTPTYDRDPERWLQYWRSQIEVVEALPGVEVAAAGYPIPGGIGGRGWIDVEDSPGVEAGADYRVVTPGYFAAVGIPLVQGRDFAETDVAGTARVAIVNRRLAEMYWPGESAIGKRLRATSMERAVGAPWLAVVGVVEDTRYDGYEAAADTALYVPLEQASRFGAAMVGVARGTPDAESALIGTLRSALRELDPQAAVELGTLESQVDQKVGARRFVASVLSIFATLALVLSAVGLYGLLSFSVAQRTREIAVRSALGARRAAIVGMVARGALVVSGCGAAIGLLAAYWMSHLVEGFLVDVGRHDPATFVIVPTILLVVALVAALVPALRASRLDPVEALRAS